ncbi:I78 family peptidase inhibitor [Cypionkella sp.]|uniref:I78 family peptidase inhibitor n=1 Tax=Cypionkella sp. TaxID=2811411 RepID=UPI002ABB5AA9|nr:I78 family peptidase inhibitor [Cypionkella sp.]MDZ4391880.1 I78 family peptidase inhibitor [Cypionkella sp.]
MRFSPLLLVLPLALMGCVPEPTPPVIDPSPVEDACGASGLQYLVGQSARKLEVMRFATTVRIIRPGRAVTMEYSAERLTIHVNAAEMIAQITCG